ncbi:RagB/SusD family nutrient uptake outer membrane protein [Catalinimonas niigatensis]|uniref:RagB/SusD family nutrient uptake outer membrane protein n=1 Tax=Catalinimonas niigatensis TaxID=1397264 RepID=UPI002665607C|nr:RagB/SusD family nutrient uptake outer membrane protein [Catalinimonas niigatensis]WPP52662.1 RagB/SusD family nutrient uptake outer membrane protein [Catalinimonas niigatensis]
MKSKIILTLSVFFLFFSSCNDEILDKDNPAQLSTATFFRSEDQALAAINAVYAALQANNLYNREYFFLHDLLSDDNQSGGAQLEAPRALILNYAFDGSNPLINAVWTGMYRIVLRANFVIQNIDEATNVSDALKTRIKGEAHFLRAWAYFELVSLWGPVPLNTEPAVSQDGTPRASSENEVYDLIFADLQIAEQNLPPKSSYSDGDLGRATEGAAQALQGKIHLFRGNYEAARGPLLEVINSGEYSLVDDFIDNFREENENNAESIFEVQFSTEFGAGGAWNGDGAGIAEVTFRGQEYGPNAWRNVIPSDGVVAEFEPNDPRNTNSFYRIGDPFNNGDNVLTETDVQGDITKPSWKKYQMIYKRTQENSESGINFRVIRYADVLLMMAEVENELSGPAAALPYINQVRARPSVDMPPYPTAEYPTGSQDQMFDAIVHERRVELAGEQIRNRDIRRWRRAGKLDSEPIPAFQSRHDLLPLPFSEIDNNSALTNADQNPGY